MLYVLKEGLWHTAQEALDYGCVDEIIEDKNDAKVDFSSANSKLNVLGLPALPDPVPVSGKSKDDSEEGLFSRFNAWMEKRKKKDAVVIPPADTNNNNQKDDMKTNFLKVNTLLNVEGLAFGEDGKVALSEDQVKAINEKLDALETENANQKTKLEEQSTQIENLKNNDGGSTTHIEGEGNDDKGNSMQSAQEMFNAVKALV